MPLPKLAPFILPITRAELPGWYRLFHHFVGDGRKDDDAWRDAGWRTIRGKWHGYRMRLDLADWSDRTTYFVGRYYETEVQLLMRALLRRGDRFVDIGANTGMLTLLGASLVGPTGRVDAFEPNPMCCRRIRQHLLINKIRHVVLHELALGEQEGEAELHAVPHHSGFGTLAPIEGEALGAFSDTHTVRVARGERVLTADDRPLRLVKIDVEGFECQTLGGLSGVLERQRPAVICEVNPYCLERAGKSLADLVALMGGMGYAAYEPRPVAGHWSNRLDLCRLDTQGDVHATDLLWLHRDAGAPELRGNVRLVDERAAAA